MLCHIWPAVTLIGPSKLEGSRGAIAPPPSDLCRKQSKMLSLKGLGLLSAPPPDFQTFLRPRPITLSVEISHYVNVPPLDTFPSHKVLAT